MVLGRVHTQRLLIGADLSAHRANDAGGFGGIVQGRPAALRQQHEAGPDHIVPRANLVARPIAHSELGSHPDAGARLAPARSNCLRNMKEKRLRSNGRL